MTLSGLGSCRTGGLYATKMSMVSTWNIDTFNNAKVQVQVQWATKTQPLVMWKIYTHCIQTLGSCIAQQCSPPPLMKKTVAGRSPWRSATHRGNRWGWWGILPAGAIRPFGKRSGDCVGWRRWVLWLQLLLMNRNRPATQNSRIQRNKKRRSGQLRNRNRGTGANLIS